MILSYPARKKEEKKRENIFKNNFYILISRPRAACEELCLQSKQARGSCWFFRSAENSPMKKQLLLSENNNICTCSDARPIYSIKQIDPKRISSRLTFQLITYIPSPYFIQHFTSNQHFFIILKN